MRNKITPGLIAAGLVCLCAWARAQIVRSSDVVGTWRFSATNVYADIPFWAGQATRTNTFVVDGGDWQYNASNYTIILGVFFVDGSTIGTLRVRNTNASQAITNIISAANVEKKGDASTNSVILAAGESVLWQFQGKHLSFSNYWNAK